MDYVDPDMTTLGGEFSFRSWIAAWCVVLSVPAALKILGAIDFPWWYLPALPASQIAIGGAFAVLFLAIFWIVEKLNT